MSDQATLPPGSLVRKHPRWLLWNGVVGRVVAVTEATPTMVRVQWANRAGLVWERADDLLPVPERPRDDDSAERSERVSGDQEQFPVGARVRPRHGSPDCEGEVIERPNSLLGYGVRWDHGVVEWYWPEHLVRIDAPEPPRAPARTLAPGIEQSSGTCDGKPRLAGTRTPTDVVRGWHGWDIFHAAHPHVTRPEYDRAVLFEAGRAWERERRRRRKEKRAVRRYERAKALAEGVVDDRG